MGPKTTQRATRVLLATATSLGLAQRSQAFEDELARLASAKNAIQFLSKEMDRYHQHFIVYEDVSSAGNHFFALGKIPTSNAAVSMNGSSSENPHSGATCIRCVLVDLGNDNYGGYYFLNGVLPNGSTTPVANFGEIAKAGVDLSGAKRLTFFARGKEGGEVVDFFLAGVGRDPATGKKTSPHPDSSPVVKIKVKLTKAWKKFSLDLSDRDLHYLLGGFGWSASALSNPGGATFFVDDIRYELSAAAKKKRLKEPRFIRSFVTNPTQDAVVCGENPDATLRNTAFSYDNALAILAFLADGSKSSVARARLLGDAFLYAQQHDRYFETGAIRDAYAAGDLALPPGWKPNGKSFTAAIPGYFVDMTDTFQELHQDKLRIGNSAWVLLALEALYEKTGATKYRDGAVELGEFIRSFRHDSGTFQGFLGGLLDPETNPTPYPWASTEHNLDIVAGFSRLATLTGDPSWLNDTEHARTFVEAMWDTSLHCYRPGTADPENRNEDLAQLPEDAQSWTALAIPGTVTLHPELLACAELHHLTTHHGFTGVDFNTNQDGVWFEGTAHLACAYAFAGSEPSAESLRATLRTAQTTAGFGKGGGLVAACHDCVTSGFDFDLLQRLHLGATAWNVFAQLRYNPFTATPLP